MLQCPACLATKPEVNVNTYLISRAGLKDGLPTSIQDVVVTGEQLAARVCKYCSAEKKKDCINKGAVPDVSYAYTPPPPNPNIDFEKIAQEILQENGLS